MNTGELVEEFLETYEGADFPHAVEVREMLRHHAHRVPGLQVIVGRLTPTKRENYRFRATMAARNPSPLTPNLADDASALVRELDAVADQPLRLWWLPLEGGRLYLVFELLTDSTIAGCLDTLDDRLAAHQ